MILYLLKSAGCLALLLCFYHLVLEKEKMHQFNRFYLLGSVLFSFLSPAYIIYIEAIPQTIETVKSTQYFYPIETYATNTPLDKNFDYSTIFIGIYILISGIIAVRFAINLFKIIHKIKTNQQEKLKFATLVLVDDKILPHSFWSYIFINKEEYKSNQIEQELLTHELTHVTQKHTIDILLMEILLIVFWINPLFLILKKAIQLNHEFLADNKVINTYKNTFQYQHLLLSKAAWNNEYYLASNLNYSLTKKRLKMMTTKSSHTIILLKKLAVIPLLTGFIFLFAERVEAQKIIEIVENTRFKKGKLSEKEIYKEFYYKDLIIIKEDKNGNKISKRYNELTNVEKAKLVPPPPIKLKKTTLTKKKLEDLKDNSKYAVWIDGKSVKNEVLNNYKNTDFSRYSNSFVYKNARSKRFPQENQINLYTNNYFNTQNKERENEFIEYIETEKLKSAKWQKLPNGENIKIIENTPLKIIREQANSTKEDKIETGFKDINNKKYYFVTVNNKTKFYNKDGKLSDNSGKIISNKKSNASEIIPGNYVTKTYFNGKLFCDFIDDNSLKTSYSKENNIKYVKEYQELNKVYESQRNKKPHFVESSKEIQKKLSNLYSNLCSMYFKLSKENKKKVKRPIPPHDPYLKLRKNNKEFYKLRSEMTEADKLLIPPPPPVPNATKEQILKAEKAYSDWKKRTGNDIQPPPPPSKKTKNPWVIISGDTPPPPPPISPLDHVIKMAKKDAIFYFENKEITSDKAIELLKKNKHLNIDTRSKGLKKPIVKISKNPISIRKE
ncbi:M56 family metallopeptidase [Polaribacter sp. MSW13]|uniref:M56 family metallopeptidase n=1 Tax=Polaribacter marinus TaxID=2916838 RepID=A0A9X1VQQ9_9FLAO|nr:M56 family metallopeptidase [Polaribacter marinus]MCI2228970.1 M56 family metallopeptidase [Polaribacter marinus]